MIQNPFKHIGPGFLVATAFVGPGTVTVCVLAGVEFGYSLLWAISLSVIATIVLQEMSSRIGLVTQKGLSEVLRESLSNRVVKLLVIALILSAIVIGNAAYEAGNLTGAVLGLQVFREGRMSFGAFETNLWIFPVGLIAFMLLYLGNYKFLERLFVALISVMSISFIITAIITKPDLLAIAKSLFVPEVPDQGALLVIALIGTTVVPYNLFLHASLVNQKWKSVDDLADARKDAILAITLGGIISMCILIAATGIGSHQVNSVSEMAESLEPLYGPFAKYTMAIGMFAAGLTSAITAPLSAAYVVQGFLGYYNQNSWKFRIVWLCVLMIGIGFSSVGLKPIEVIKFAQVTNGLLLPVISVILVWLANQKKVLGSQTNTLSQNLLSFIILLIATILGAMSIIKVIG